MDDVRIGIFILNLLISAAVGYGAAAFKIGEYKNKVDTLESTVGKDEHGGLRRTLGEVKDKVVACEVILKERGPLAERKSPISLTERGDNVLKESGGMDYVDDQKESLLAFIRDKNPKSAYDVQEFAKLAMELRAKEDDFIPLKNYAYKEGMDLDDILFVTGIYLRDITLDPLGFSHEDIDKFDPNRKTLT